MLIEAAIYINNALSSRATNSMCFFARVIIKVKLYTRCNAMQLPAVALFNLRFQLHVLYLVKFDSLTLGRYDGLYLLESLPVALNWCHIVYHELRDDLFPYLPYFKIKVVLDQSQGDLRKWSRIIMR